MPESDSAQRLARASADHMWVHDWASRKLGMCVENIAPGRAVLTMIVTEAMLGPGRVCRRGLVFTLADSAMAYASNSHGRLAVAQMADIIYDRDVVVGTRLTAIAEERHRTGRKALYDVRVTADDGTIVAEFRGQTISLGDLFATMAKT